MKRLKPLSFFIFAIALFCLGMPTDASANSAQRYFYGTTSSGAFVKLENCPIEVEYEQLTFDIRDFPPMHEGQYSSSVTATYGLFNPKDFDVTVDLCFPIGNSPDYYYYNENDDTPYSFYGNVTLGGETVPYEKRHTFTPNGSFDASEVKKILNDYKTAQGITPQTPVYTYKATVEGITSDIPAPVLSIDFQSTDGINFMSEGYGGYERLGEKGARVGMWLEKTSTSSVYFSIIGREITGIENMLSVYRNMSYKDRVDLPVSLTKTEQITFSELILSTYQEGEISKIDYYNAYIDSLAVGKVFHLGDYPRRDNILHSLMSWYCYTVTVPTLGRVENSVTVPVFPTVDMGYTPSVYSYEYLLSPAAGWASFKDLTVTVNTDYYMTGGQSKEYFTKTQTGYEASFSSLPNGELYFSLSAEQDPAYESAYGGCSSTDDRELLAIISIFLFIVLGFYYLFYSSAFLSFLIIPVASIVAAIIITVTVLRKGKKTK